MHFTFTDTFRPILRRSEAVSLISTSQDLNTSPELNRQFKEDDGWMQPAALDARWQEASPPRHAQIKRLRGNYTHAPVVEVNEVMIPSVFKVIQQVGAQWGGGGTITTVQPESRWF